MTVSEFWKSIEAVFGSCYGRSIVGDLFLPKLGGTAEQALMSGLDPSLWMRYCPHYLQASNAKSDYLPSYQGKPDGAKIYSEPKSGVYLFAV